jgi:hypothetical protein
MHFSRSVPAEPLSSKAGLSEPVLSKAFTRFRMPWHWDGGPATLQSRAWDDAGNVQPTRAEFVAQRGELKAVPPVGAVLNHHFNAGSQSTAGQAVGPYSPSGPGDTATRPEHGGGNLGGGGDSM